MRRVLALLFVVAVALAGCAETSAPLVTTETPQNISAPTHTRAAELSQLATLTVPTATAPATATAITLTATTVPTATAVPPTPTFTPTATLILPTPTPDYAAAHARYFAQKNRQASSPLVTDVTGDNAPEHIYASFDCASCRIRFITVFSGPDEIFDDGDYLEPVVTALSDHTGFTITEKVLYPGESFDTASGRITWTFRYSGSRFTFVGKQETRVSASGTATAVPPPAGGSVQVTPVTSGSSETVARYKADLLAEIDKALPVVADVIVQCPGANQLICQSKYDTAYRAVSQLGLYIFDSLGSGFPGQCETLWLDVSRLRGEAAKALDASYQRTGSVGFISTSEAVSRAQYAQRQLQAAKSLVVNQPGSCR